MTRTGHHEINTYNSAGGWPGLDAPKTTLRVPQVPCSWGPWEAPDLNWQKEAHGLAGSVPANAAGSGQVPSYLSYRKLGAATKDY